MNEQFAQGQIVKTVLDKEVFSSMITSEFQVKGFIPGNIILEVKEFDVLDDFLELTLRIHKEYVN